MSETTEDLDTPTAGPLPADRAIPAVVAAIKALGFYDNSLGDDVGVQCEDHDAVVVAVLAGTSVPDSIFWSQIGVTGEAFPPATEASLREAVLEGLPLLGETIRRELQTQADEARAFAYPNGDGPPDPMSAPAADPAPPVIYEQVSLFEANQITAQIRDLVGVLWRNIAHAYQVRVWVPLGYQSWDEYCVGEFSGLNLRLPREERTETVASLRDAGLSIRAIAAATGSSVGTVHADISGVQNRTPDPDELGGEIDLDYRSGDPHTVSAVQEMEPVDAGSEDPASSDPAPPPTITGADGKTYPAKATKKEPAAAPPRAPGTSTQPAHGCGRPGCRDWCAPALDFCAHHQAQLDAGREIADDPFFGTCAVAGCSNMITDPHYFQCVHHVALEADAIHATLPAGPGPDTGSEPEPNLAYDPDHIVIINGKRRVHADVWQETIDATREAIEELSLLSEGLPNNPDRLAAYRNRWDEDLEWVGGCLAEITANLGINQDGSVM